MRSAGRSIGIAWIVASCCATIGVLPSTATIRYQISLAHPEQHLFHVTMTIPEVKGEVTVQMAAWNALYQIKDFSSHVQRVEPSQGSEPATIEKMDKQTWQIRGTGTVTIRYATYWDEPGPFASQLNGDHAFINPAMILMYVPGRRMEDVHFSLLDVPGDWQAAGPLIGFTNSMGETRSFAGDAPNYDALADAPIEVGKFKEFELSGLNPEISVVVDGDQWDEREVKNELARICEYEEGLMGGAPFERYTFILHIGKGAEGAGGGMEHANSTAIFVPSAAYLPNVAAHELFHLWNVKRIRPASLYPVDYTKEQYTRALWFAEGVTNTYASYTLVRSGLWSKQQFYDDLSEQISELEARPANRWQSAEQSSLDAWLEKYHLYNQPDYSVSYYTKGQILGTLLDIAIRDRSNDEKSLDDVLRAMNDEFAKKAKAYRDSLDVRLTAEQVAGSSFEDFFKKYVSGTEPLPYKQLLGLAGLELSSIEQKRAILGFLAERDDSGAEVVRSLDSGGHAEQAGLRTGDVLLKWNEGDVPHRPARWVMERNPGDILRVKVRRGEKEISLEFPLGETSETFYQVTEINHASERARRIRNGLLHGVTERMVIH